METFSALLALCAGNASVHIRSQKSDETLTLEEHQLRNNCSTTFVMQPKFFEVNDGSKRPP